MQSLTDRSIKLLTDRSTSIHTIGVTVVPSTREKIRRAAARLFLERSYQDVGVEEICAAANVRRASLYHFYDSKAGLACAVVDLHAAALWTALDGIDEDRPVERLYALVDNIVAIQVGFQGRHGRTVGCPFGNLVAELSTVEPEVRARLQCVLTELEHRIAVTCHQVHEIGAFRAGVEPDEFAHALVSLLQGLMLMAKMNDSPADAISRHLRRMVAIQLTTTDSEKSPATIGSP
jgi:TetR/AcrR family transcriptional repressor of nem operon